MRNFFSFLVNQKGEFFSTFCLIFIVVAIVGFFIVARKFELSFKGYMITSVIISSFVLMMTYSIGYSCYTDLKAPREKESILDIDKSLNKVVLDFLKINYENIE